MNPGTIRSICVAGGGLVGLSAALAFARALPHVRVSLLAVPADPAALADRLPGTLPTIHRFHANVGLDEFDLVRAGVATHLLGARFERWAANGEPWLHVFGESGMPAGDAVFHNVWVRARQVGRALPFHRYAAAAAFAAAGKFAHPSADPRSPLGTFLYALRLDPTGYREALAHAAAQLERVNGRIGDVARTEDGRVAALLLRDGRRVEADLYVDCTGPSATLLSALDSGFEDWGEWLPCDRVRIGDEPAQEATACDVVTATGSGWCWQAPLADRTLAIVASSSAHEEKVGVEAVEIRPGRRRDPWIRNVVAIGDAAVAVDPLHGTNLHLAQSAILRAIELLPRIGCQPFELSEYNRRTEQEVTRVRDFLALHYLRSGRDDPPLWASLRHRRPPESLARTLDQFERRGRLPFFEEESFDRNSWLAALLGLGVIPQPVEAVAAGVDLDQASAAMAALAARLAGLPGRFPAYGKLLARMKAGPAA